ncbi:LLM class flavin-dependent oxidoreductase [Rhodococcus olei]|uniref:LLM class flavin-dependent oxidoreductase n=1 Tax=Rhodococcus olei TaxID=2161675 RepID=A0ABP8PQM2_9NOCA
MKVGAFTQGYVRRDSNPQQRFGEVIREAAAAEEAGLSSFGVSEQHFKFPTNSTGPIDSLMAAVAQATERIDITPGVVVLPVHHPIHTAERWAAIDIISNGRVRFGVGKGNTPLTADVFGVHTPDAEAMTIEALEIIVKAWTEEKFSFDGRFWKIPEVGLCPRPIQQPHPPLAYSGITKESALVAARLQVGMMGGAIASDWEALEDLINAYRDAWDEGTPLPNAVPDKTVRVLVNGHIASTFDQVRDEVAHGLIPYVNRVITMKREMLRRNGTPNPTYLEEYYDNFDAAINLTPGMFGTPEQLLPALKQFQALGIDELIVNFDFAQHDELVQSIKLLGELAQEVK